MALTVQNDDGDVENANAYIDVEYFNAYFSDRGVDVSDFDETQIEGAIVSATQYIDIRYSYSGNPLYPGQTTEFPRADLVDRYDNDIEGLPSNLKKATAEYARQALLLGGQLVATPESSIVTVKREKVGPIEEETQYSVNTNWSGLFTPYPMADALLAPYIFRVRSFSVYRA